MFEGQKKGKIMAEVKRRQVENCKGKRGTRFPERSYRVSGVEMGEEPFEHVRNRRAPPISVRQPFGSPGEQESPGIVIQGFISGQLR